MKKITNKFFVSLFAVALMVVGAVGLTACADKTDENLCTVSYNLNFDDKDYQVLKSCMDNGLSFDVTDFKNESMVIKLSGVSIVYSTQQEIGRSFNLYKFADKVLNNYFDGWYTYSGIKIDDSIVADGDITLYAKWNENLSDLTYTNGTEFEYKFNETTQTVSFKNARTNYTHNGVGILTLPELVFNNGKFYALNDIEYNSSRDHMVYCVPKTYTGNMEYPIVFPNEDASDSSLTYLGNYISQLIGKVICIYEADYTTNTLKLRSLKDGSVTSSNPYLKLGEDIVLHRTGESSRTLKITNLDWIFPGDTCSYTKFIISEDAKGARLAFWNVLQNNNNNPIDIYFEISKDEVAEVYNGDWIETSNHHIPFANIYYYSETEPASDGYNYWHYVGSSVTVWGE